MYYKLTKKIEFPDPRYCEIDESGLLAIGGDLSIERLCLAYQYGIFPWFPYRDKIIQWYCPRQRFVIFPNEIHISHSMRNIINKGEYFCQFDSAFDEVIHGCSAIDSRNTDQCAWLGDDMIKAYTKLYELGIAHSVEVRRKSDNKVVGGLYGVLSGTCFCGESMFSLEPNTSKLALIMLSKFASQIGIQIIDCQIENPHLKSMGGRYIPYFDYINYLAKGLGK